MQPHVHRQRQSKICNTKDQQSTTAQWGKRVTFVNENFVKLPIQLGLARNSAGKQAWVGKSCHCLQLQCTWTVSCYREGKHASGTSGRLLQWRVWKKKSNVNLINVRSGTFCQRGRESRKRKEGEEKGSRAANSPSTKFWPRCHSRAAIWWIRRRFSLPLCCQQASSDANSREIRHLIEKTLALACWATCSSVHTIWNHG